jgi:hypothetical protein
MLIMIELTHLHRRNMRRDGHRSTPLWRSIMLLSVADRAKDVIAFAHGSRAVSDHLPMLCATTRGLRSLTYEIKHRGAPAMLEIAL